MRKQANHMSKMLIRKPKAEKKGKHALVRSTGGLARPEHNR